MGRTFTRDTPLSEYPKVEDFEVRIDWPETSTAPAREMGSHVHFFRRGAPDDAPLAGFPYLDQADAVIRTWTDRDLPGLAEECVDCDQSWEIVIFPEGGYIYVLQGDDPDPGDYYAGFRVRRELYVAAWRRAIAEARERGTTFQSLAEALRFPKKARTLNLYYKRLGGKLPDEIGTLTELEELNLTYNQLARLPDALGQLEKLRHLCLTNNELTEVPPVIRRLKRLETLDLGKNRISTVPEWLAELAHLDYVLLTENPARGVPPALEAQKRTTYIMGSGSMVPGADRRYFGKPPKADP